MDRALVVGVMKRDGWTVAGLPRHDTRHHTRHHTHTNPPTPHTHQLYLANVSKDADAAFYDAAASSAVQAAFRSVRVPSIHVSKPLTTTTYNISPWGFYPSTTATRHPPSNPRIS